jgi:hypothetical protein
MSDQLSLKQNMTFRTSTRTKIVAVTALVILLVAQQTLEIPGYGRLARGTQDAMYGPWFAMVTALVWILLFRPISISLGRGTAMFLLVVSVVCLAIATECLQVLTGREGSLRDVMLDMGGAGGTVAAIGWRQRHRNGNMIQATILSLAGITCLLWSISPMLVAATTNAYRDWMAPQLIGFESKLEYEILSTNSEVRVVPAPVTWNVYQGRSVLKVRLAQARWREIRLQETISDWSSHSVLVLDIFSATDQMTRLTVSVRPNDPLSNGTLNFLHVFQLTPGANNLRVPIDRLLPDRDTHTWLVRDVGLYSNRSHAGQVVYIGQIGLE